MKKILLILIAVVTLSVFSISKSNAQVKVNVGLRIGFNASKITGDYTAGNKFVPGLHIGPFVRVGFKDKYRISVDALFSTKGTSFSTPTLSGGTEKYYYIPFYIDVPVLFNYKPIAGLYVEAGVQPSFAMTALSFSKNTESSFDKGNLKTLDFAPVVGLGYEFKKVSLGIRGIFGVTNVNDGISGALFNQKNMTLMATFGFKFL